MRGEQKRPAIGRSAEAMGRKTKKCKQCGKEFQPFQTTQKVCSPKCALDFAKEKAVAERKKQNKADVRAMRENDRRHQLRLAQAAFNAFIRARDADLPCISCGTTTAGQWDASHYRSVGARPAMRFDEKNCHRSCATCNNHLSGNIVGYRKGLVARYGEKYMEHLEFDHPPSKLTLDEIKQITKLYRQKLKEINANG